MSFARLAAVLLVMSSLPALAQDQPELVAGATVYGPDGLPAATIREVSGGAVVVFTGRKVVTLGIESFVSGKAGPRIGYTAAQLDAAIEAIEREREARLAAAIAVGRELRSNDGKIVGKVQAINADGSVVIVQEDRAFTLLRSQLGADGAGLIVLFSAAQLEAALKAAAGGPN